MIEQKPGATPFQIGCGPDDITCISGTVGPVDWDGFLNTLFIAVGIWAVVIVLILLYIFWRCR